MTAKEKHLNQLYADIFSEEQAVEQFEYMINKSRGKHTTISAIRVAHTNHELGSLLKKYDPIAFNSSEY